MIPYDAEKLHQSAKLASDSKARARLERELAKEALNNQHALPAATLAIEYADTVEALAAAADALVQAAEASALWNGTTGLTKCSDFSKTCAEFSSFLCDLAAMNREYAHEQAAM